MQMLGSTEYQIILVYPNADAGGRAMIEKINEYDVDAYRNIPHEDFIGLLGSASMLIGNSSSGIIESSSFKLPVINIGTRQQGREKSSNVIDADYNSEEILSAIKYIDSDEYKNKLNECINPYGDGKSSEKICDILKNIQLNDALLNKNFFIYS